MSEELTQLAQALGRLYRTAVESAPRLSFIGMVRGAVLRFQG